MNLAEAQPEISRARADALLAALPKGDPWEKTPDASVLAWIESATLQALVEMYEATGDPAYLREVAQRGERELSHRDDRRGVVDGSGKSRPAWSMGSKYVVATGQLKNGQGAAVIQIRSTPSAYNLETVVTLTPAEGARFSLKAVNKHFQREETFTDLSLEPADPRFAEKIVNDPFSPYSPKPGTCTQNSHLIRLKVAAEAKGGAMTTQQVTLQPVPLAYMGYLGIIYDPLLRMAEHVRARAELKELAPAAESFIKAAEVSYADAAARLWRSGPKPGEGYYLTCEKGESFPADNVGQPFNFLAKHVCAELALHRLTGKAVYRERSEAMVRMFKNRLTHRAEGDLYIWTYWYEPMTTVGWKGLGDPSANIGFFHGDAIIEDTSHGVLDCAMVMAAHHAGIGFASADVRRFANTFLKNVLLPDRSGVRRRVDGVGEAYAPYFRASHGWLALAEVDAEVYRGMREAYLKWGQEDFRFLAHLLKWERKLGAAAR